ncbi:hypothetical protein D1094_06805 [Colwellia sp. RSH04]|nr:hypothetical protein D1094_06805 [Colwellia sp. RSH04]
MVFFLNEIIHALIIKKQTDNSLLIGWGTLTEIKFVKICKKMLLNNTVPCATSNKASLIKRGKQP